MRSTRGKDRSFSWSGWAEGPCRLCVLRSLDVLLVEPVGDPERHTPLGGVAENELAMKEIPVACGEAQGAWVFSDSVISEGEKMTAWSHLAASGLETNLSP